MTDQPVKKTQCLAEEWQRDGRGFWAMRVCGRAAHHKGRHELAVWSYNVKWPASDAITSLRQQVETLKQDVSIWKASSEKWAQRHAEVHAQVETLTQENTTMREHMLPPLWKRIEDMKAQLASLAAVQERMTEAVTRSVAELRHAYLNLRDNRVSRSAQHAFADGLLAPQIRRLETVLALPSLAASSRETTNETKD